MITRDQVLSLWMLTLSHSSIWNNRTPPSSPFVSQGKLPFFIVFMTKDSEMATPMAKSMA
jgi:hypothetical protein